MMRRCFSLCLAVAILAPGLPVRADDTPVIVTYELRKQRQAARLVERNPKSFWVHQVLARIEGKAPVLSKPLKEAVTVRLTFIVGRDGHITSKAVTASSGNANADEAALAMLERAQPFPRMPAAMTETDQSFALPVRFH